MSHTRDSHWYYAEIFERSLFGKKGETAVKGHICHQCGLQSKSKALWRLLVLTGFLFLLSPTPLCTQLFCYVGTIKREDCGIHSRKLRETISSEHLNELHEMSLPWKSLLPPPSLILRCPRLFAVFFASPPLRKKTANDLRHLRIRLPSLSPWLFPYPCNSYQQITVSMPKYNLKWQIKLNHYFWNENNLRPEAVF